MSAPGGGGGGGVRVRLLTRAGCHLCAAAREVVAAVVAPGGWEEVDVDDPATDPALRAAHTDWVPVLLLDGAVHDQLRVDAQRLRRALARPPGRRRRPW